MRTRAFGLDKPARARQRRGLDGPPAAQAVNARVQRLRQYRWSSYRAYIGLDAPPPWLHMTPVLERVGPGRLNRRNEKYRAYVEQQIREGLSPSPWEQLVERTVLGAERFVRKLRERLPPKARDVTGLKGLLHRGNWAQVVAAVEAVMRQPWKHFRDRHADPGRDMALYLGRKVAGLKLSELGHAAGDLDFRSVSAAIVRFERKLNRDKHLCKLVENAKTQMQNAEL